MAQLLRTSIFPVLLLLLQACVADHAERIYINLPPSAGPVEVLREIPSRPYNIVADIQWQGGKSSMMATRAQKLGGDAVIIQYLGGPVLFSSVTAEQANSSTKYFNRMAGTVIQYK